MTKTDIDKSHVTHYAALHHIYMMMMVILSIVHWVMKSASANWKRFERGAWLIFVCFLAQQILVFIGFRSLNLFLNHQIFIEERLQSEYWYLSLETWSERFIAFSMVNKTFAKVNCKFICLICQWTAKKEEDKLERTSILLL